MALTITDRGTGGNNASSASLSVTPGSNLAAGSLGVLRYAGDNAGGNQTSNVPTSITDSVGNVWYLRVNSIQAAAANAGAEAAIYTSNLTIGFTTSDNLVLTFTVGNVTAKCWTLSEVVPSGSNIVIFKNGAGALAPASTAPSITSGTISNGDAILGVTATESADTFTPDSDTTNGSWSTHQHTSFGSGTTGMSITSQQKIVTASATQTYNVAQTSADAVIAWAAVGETDAKCRGTFANAATQAAITWNPALPLRVGSFCVLACAFDNSGTGGTAQNIPSSFNDSAGNTWTLQNTGIYSPGAAGTGVEFGLYTSTIATQLNPIGTLTITYLVGNVTGKGLIIWEFVPGTNKLYASSSYLTGAAGTGAATGTPTVTTSSITSGDYVVGVCGAESADTFAGDADASSGTWSTHAHISSGTGATGMSITSQWKLTTGTATQTYNPTLTSADTIIGWLSFRELNAYTMAADQGNFTLSGQAVTLTYTAGKVLTAAVGSFTHTGQSVNLLFGRKVAADFGSFTQTGQSVNLLWKHVLSATFGNFTLSGQSVTLTFTPAATLSATGGTFTFGGQDVTLACGRFFAANFGSFTHTGQAVSFSINKAIAGNCGTFVLSGQDVALTFQGLLGLTALTGQFQLNGFPVTLRAIYTGDPFYISQFGGTSMAINQGSLTEMNLIAKR